jgi:hypothetical protein
VVSRLLKQLEEEGRVKLGRNKITLLNTSSALNPQTNRIPLLGGVSKIQRIFDGVVNIISVICENISAISV